MIKKGDLVIRLKDFDEKKFPHWNLPAVIIRDPYKTVIKLSDKLTATETVVDLIINGVVYTKIPIIHLKAL